MRYFCIVDKSFGESHSFVDGMLKQYVLPRDAGSCVVYAKAQGGFESSSFDSRFSIEMSVARKGFGRIVLPIFVLKYFVSVFGFKERTAVFIRNEPLVVFVFSLLKLVFPQRLFLIFQSSFPHEIYSGNVLSRFLARVFMRMALARCDQVVVVSEGAKNRILTTLAKGFNGKVSVIPLCCDFESGLLERSISGDLKFVYVGSYARLRQLDVVVFALFKVMEAGGRFRVDFYGMSRQEFVREYPLADSCVLALEERGFLSFCGRVGRGDIPGILGRYDVGLNLIPPIPVYVESSSTKLGEYLSQGLPVISSKGIPYHEDVHRNEMLGWLVDFSMESIAGKILEVIKNGRPEVARRHADCRKYVDLHLRYTAYAACLP